MGARAGEQERTQRSGRIVSRERRAGDGSPLDLPAGYGAQRSSHHSAVGKSHGEGGNSPRAEEGR